MAHCHGCEVEINVPAGAKRIVLAGNPNSGKSVFFNELTGMYVDVSNYPGTTLDISYGKLDRDVVIDTPGVYGISSFNDEEKVARDVILTADLVINVVNAVFLERDLFLTQQIIDTGVPVVVALNMVDEAELQGLIIDYKLMSSLLGVPVIPTIAVKKKGIEELKAMLSQASTGVTDPDLESKLQEMTNRVGSRGEALLILEGDSVIAERHGVEPMDLREEIYLKRRQRVNEVIELIVKDSNKKSIFLNSLSRLMIRPLTGIPILLVALFFMYEIIGVFVAGTIVGITEETIILGYYVPFIRGFISQFISEESIIWTILVGEFGVLTMTVTYILGLLLPLVAGFYFFLSLFEDSGYLPRIATLVDRLLTKIGLNGRAVIPLILGFGCVTMAIITTRLLGSEREQRIATFLLAVAIPCSAQLAVIVAMLAGLGMNYVILYSLIIFTVLVLMGTWMNNLMKGKSSDLLIDIPPLRLPRLDNIIRKTTIKTYHFLKEAFPLFAIGAFIISVFQISGILAALQNLLAPLTVNWLGLPKESANFFVMGVIRRDFGAVGLSELALTPMQTIVALVTITLFVPCIASMLVIWKERSRREAVAMWLGAWIIAFLTGGIVYKLALFWGVSSDLNNGYGFAGLMISFIVLAVILVFTGKIIGLRIKSPYLKAGAKGVVR